jgi:hypothetical protein
MDPVSGLAFGSLAGASLKNSSTLDPIVRAQTLLGKKIPDCTQLLGRISGSVNEVRATLCGPSKIDLAPPEPLSGPCVDRKSRAHARISIDSPGRPKTEGLEDGGPSGI